MINPQNANAEGITREMAAAASAIGVQIEVVPASDIEAALAVVKLITKSNFVDWTTGRSAGLAPLRYGRYRRRSAEMSR